MVSWLRRAIDSIFASTDGRSDIDRRSNRSRQKRYVLQLALWRRTNCSVDLCDRLSSAGKLFLFFFSKIYSIDTGNLAFAYAMMIGVQTAAVGAHRCSVFGSKRDTRSCRQGSVDAREALASRVDGICRS